MMVSFTEMRAELTSQFILVALIASLGAFSFGFDNGWWGFVLGSGYFNKFYGDTAVTSASGVTSKALSSTQTACGTGLSSAGTMLGVAVAPFFNKRYGRKFCFFALGVVGVLGCTVQALSAIRPGLFWVLIAGKIIVNVSIGLASAVVGVYLAECAHPATRGFAVAFYVVTQTGGNLVAGGVVYGVIDKQTKENFLLPICIQYIIPLIILAATPWLIESPRWLVSKGRREDAKQALLRVRKPRQDGGDDQRIESELDGIAKAYTSQFEHGEDSWAALFKGFNRKRTLVAVGLQCLQQAQGTSFMSNYLIVTLLRVGIHDVYKIVVILFAFLHFTSYSVFFLADKVGRRLLLLIGAVGMSVCMATVAGIATTEATPTGARANLLVGAVFIWIGFFSATWSNVPWIVASEISNNSLREKTLAVAALSGFAVQLIVVFVSPYIQDAGYGNLGAKIGFIWMCFSLISWVWTYFCVPECAGRTLEELDLLFENHIPVRKFAGFEVAQLRPRDGDVEEVTAYTGDEKKV